MSKINLLCFIVLYLFVQNLHAQSNEEKAYSKGHEAIQLMEKGQIKESIKLLEEAKKLDPKNINYPYEIAYAHVLDKNYKSAIKILNGLLKHNNVNDRVYQLLGNSYSMNMQREQAINTYEAGLEKFPSSGLLYLERGNMELMIKEYGNALSFYEKGIYVSPSFPSNYYWASKLYLNSSEEVWGMIYGEIFMNLERNSKRTAEISKLLFDTYKSEITFVDENSISVSFSKNAEINISSLTDSGGFKLPFGIGVYEPVLLLSLVLQTHEINLNSLHQIRSNFVDNYFKTEHHLKYPNCLFDYQKKIKDAGHFEAYNYWILMKGNEDEFVAWKNEHTGQWDAFVDWFMENKLILNETTKFHSSQY